MAKLQDMDIEDIIFNIVLTFFLALLGLALILLFASEKRPIAYYLDYGANGMSCVSASTPWDADKPVFCSNDPDKVLRFLKDANASLREPTKENK